MIEIAVIIWILVNAGLIIAQTTSESEKTAAIYELLSIIWMLVFLVLLLFITLQIAQQPSHFGGIK